MEGRIPFDIKLRPEIEAGKYLVVMRGGKSARIVCWEKQGRFPIVALLKEREEDEDEVMRDYCIDGRYYEDETSHRDLFLVANPDYKEPTTTCSTSVDWDAFRREAAKDIVAACYTNRNYDRCPEEHIAKTALKQADELIKQLKENKK